MAFTREGDAVGVSGTIVPGSAGSGIETSTCTMNLYEYYGGVDDLCMFGLTASQLGQNIDRLYAEEPVALSGDAEATRDNNLLYVHSASAFFDIVGGADPVKVTVIPTSRTGQTWYYTAVYYADNGETQEDIEAMYAYDSDIVVEGYSVTDGAAGIPYYNIRNLQLSFDVHYGGPSIVRLPDQKGWLMLLTRIRTEAGNPAGVELSDIVAYWASDDCPEFKHAWDGDSGVAGPIWIAPNIGALGRFKAGVETGGSTLGIEGVRYVLSVPTGAVFTTTEGTTSDGYTFAAYFVVKIPSRDDIFSDINTEEIAARAMWTTELRYFAGGASEGFDTCIAAYLFNLDDIMTAVGQMQDSRTAPDGSYVEAVWAKTEYDSDQATTYKIPVERLTLYTWLGGPTDLRGEESHLALADPQCVRCSLGTPDGTLSELRLFHSALGGVPPGEETHRGIWVAHPSDEATKRVRADGTEEDVIRGVDFDYSGNTPSIEENPDTSLNPIDPDPVQLSSGEWVLYHGQADSVGENIQGALQYAKDDSGDVCDSTSRGASSEEDDPIGPIVSLLPWLADSLVQPEDPWETSIDVRELYRTLPWLKDPATSNSATGGGRKNPRRRRTAVASIANDDTFVPLPDPSPIDPPGSGCCGN